MIQITHALGTMAGIQKVVNKGHAKPLPGVTPELREAATLGLGHAAHPSGQWGREQSEGTCESTPDGHLS